MSSGTKLKTDTSDRGRAENVTVVPQQESRPLTGLLENVTFSGQCIDTGAVRNVLSYDCYKRLPESLSLLCMRMAHKCL